MNASDLLAEFAHRARVQDLKLSEAGTARLLFDDQMAVDIEWDEPGRRLYLYTSLGLLPQHDRESRLAMLLQANLFGQGTGGAHLGLDAARNELLLCRQLDLDSADYIAFEAALQALVDAAEALGASLGAWVAAPPSPPPGEFDPRALQRA